MRSLLWGGIIGASLCGILGPTFVTSAAQRPEANEVREAPPPDVQRVGHFIELEDGRRLARLDGWLRRGERYRLTIGATGSDVEPLPGWRGVAGANTLTAQELDALLRDGALAAYVVRRDGSNTEATVRAGARERLPIRKTGADGRVDFRARTDEAHVTRIEVDTGVLAFGTYTLEIEARGEVRLRSEFRLGDDGGAIVTFETTGGLHRIGTERP